MNDMEMKACDGKMYNVTNNRRIIINLNNKNALKEFLCSINCSKPSDYNHIIYDKEKKFIRKLEGDNYVAYEIVHPTLQFSVKRCDNGDYEIKEGNIQDVNIINFVKKQSRAYDEISTTQRRIMLSYPNVDNKRLNIRIIKI
jgi:hypothetical protein